MTGLDTSTALPARLITGRFPARLVDTQAPRHALGAILAEVITRPPAARSHIVYRRCLNCWFSWLYDQPIRLTTDLDELRRSTAPLPEHSAATVLDRLCAITEGEITAYLAELNRRTIAPASINSRLTVLRLLYHRLHRYGLVTLDPMADIRSRKVSQQSSTAWLTADQVRQLLDSLGGSSRSHVRDRAIISLMVRTGLRASECRLAQAEDLALIGGHHVLTVTGKGGARERVKVPTDVADNLRAWLDLSGITHGPMFRRVNTGPDLQRHGPLTPKSFAGLIYRRYTKAGLPVGVVPHSLRHTFITLAIRGGAPLPKVQIAARHRNPQTTMRYAHDLDGLDDNAVDYIHL